MGAVYVEFSDGVVMIQVVLLYDVVPGREREELKKVPKKSAPREAAMRARVHPGGDRMREEAR